MRVSDSRTCRTSLHRSIVGFRSRFDDLSGRNVAPRSLQKSNTRASSFDRERPSLAVDDLFAARPR